MVETLALARYSPYFKSSYVNGQGCIRWYPSKSADSFYLKHIYQISEKYNRKLSVSLEN